MAPKTVAVCPPREELEAGSVSEVPGEEREYNEPASGGPENRLAGAGDVHVGMKGPALQCASSNLGGRRPHDGRQGGHGGWWWMWNPKVGGVAVN